MAPKHPVCGISGGRYIIAVWHIRAIHQRPASHQQPLGFGNLFGQALGSRPARRRELDFQPVKAGQFRIGRQLLNLVIAGQATPERVVSLLSSVPALKKIPVGKLASAPGLGEQVLRLVAGRAKRGQLVEDEEFLGLIEAAARPSPRR